MVIYFRFLHTSIREGHLHEAEQESILAKDKRSDDPGIEGLTGPQTNPAELEEASEKLKDKTH